MALSEVLYISHVTCYINFKPLSVWPASQSVSLNLTVLSSPALTIIQRVVLSSVLSFKLTTLQVLISPPKQRLFSIRYFYHKTSVCLWLLSPQLSVCTYYYYYYYHCITNNNFYLSPNHSPPPPPPSSYTVIASKSWSILHDQVHQGLM